MVNDLSALWTYIADTACRGYSPLYDRICRVVADNDAVLRLVSRSPASGHNPLLLLAAVHYLVLDGVDHPLGVVYAGESDADPGELFVDLCLEHQDAVLQLLATRQVNTNEVGRSAVIGPALTTVASRFDMPVAHVDVGCSAGLNLLCDRYRLDYGPLGASGPADARVRVSCDVVAGSPPVAPMLPEVAARVGLDRAPVDVHDPDQLRWQLACAWPDTARVERTRLALEEAQHAPLTLVRGDAVDDIGGLLAQFPQDAIAVVTTTLVVAYLSRAQRAAFADALAAASRARPVVWISAESQGVVDTVPSAGAPTDANGVQWSVLGCVTFRAGGTEPELLGYVHPHGSALDWREGVGPGCGSGVEPFSSD